VLTLDGGDIGYGSIKGQEVAGRDTVFEFYVIPPFRRHASLMFAVRKSRARQLIA
jgi:hypothetical protein